MKHYHDQSEVAATIDIIKLDPQPERAVEWFKGQQADAQHVYDTAMSKPDEDPELVYDAEQTLAYYNDVLELLNTKGLA